MSVFRSKAAQLFLRKFAVIAILGAVVSVLHAMTARGQEYPAPDQEQATGAAAGHHGHGVHGGMGTAKESGAADGAYAAAMQRMHEDMAVAPTGDADVDFVKGMIPHHRGAVDMAKVLLEHGNDPELRKLAEEIVSAQEREIAFMKAWLKKREAK